MKLSTFVFLALVGLLGLSSLRGNAQEVLARSGTLLPRDLLDGLDPVMSNERRPTVDGALAAYPGSAEVFLLALLDQRSQDFLWANPGRALAPWDPGAAAQVLPGRALAVERLPDNVLPEISVTLAKAIHVPTRTYIVSPLLLDLNFDGVPGVKGGRWQPHPGTDFTGLLVADINADGFPDLTEWVDGTDGLLIDPSDPSRIEDGAAGPTWNGPWSGRDLVGTAEGYRNGFEKLFLRDANADGSVSGSELSGLYIWQDANRNGAIEAGELTTLAQQTLIDFRQPTNEDAGVGRFTAAGRTGNLWDWWPSYALAKKQPTGIVPEWPTSMDLTGKTITLEVEPDAIIGPLADLDGDGAPDTLRRSDLIAAGMDWDTLVLLGVSPGGSRILLSHRGLSPERVRAGAATALWVLERDGLAYQAHPYLIPLRDIEQAVFRSEDNLLLSGDGGGTMLAFNLQKGVRDGVTRFLEVQPDQPGFRIGSVAWSNRNRFRPSFFDVFVEGAFYNAGHYEDANVIASLTIEQPVGELMQVARIVKANQTSNLRQQASVRGAIRASLFGLSDRAYFLVETPGGDGLGTRIALDPTSDVDNGAFGSGALLRGMAASGDRVLFFRPTMLLGAPAGAVDVVVHEVATGAESVLGTGDYYYPYLEDDGRVAVVARIDWASGGMDYFAGALDGPMPQARALAPLFSSNGIGTFRSSEDGGTYAFLGPEGLRAGTIPRPRRFLRGNANGSALPAEQRRAIDISDAIYLLSSLFLGGPAPPCMDAADANDDGRTDISDAIKILGHLFGGGPDNATLPPPWPEAGVDPSDDALGCLVPQ